MAPHDTLVSTRHLPTSNAVVNPEARAAALAASKRPRQHQTGGGESAPIPDERNQRPSTASEEDIVMSPTTPGGEESPDQVLSIIPERFLRWNAKENKIKLDGGGEKKNHKAALSPNTGITIRRLRHLNQPN